MTINSRPGKERGLKSRQAVGSPTATKLKTTHPQGGLSVPNVSNTSFIRPTTQDAFRDHHYYPFRQSSTQGSPPSPLDCRSCSHSVSEYGGKSPPVLPAVRPPFCWHDGGLSIAQLHNAYLLTFRPIIVHKGKVVGRGPVWS